jgi:NHL repeat
VDPPARLEGGQGFGTASLADGVCSFRASCTGSPTGATFNGAGGIALASPGVLFVTDVYNCALRKLTFEPGCSVTTVGRAGCPMFVSDDTSGIVRNPFGVTAGVGLLSGRAVVADTGNHRVATVNEAGLLTSLAGTRTRGFVDGAAAEAQFNAPSGVVMDAAGRIIVADTGNNRLRVLTPVVR